MANITKRFVEVATTGRHYDDRLVGFGLYVGASGVRTYFFEYRPGRGRSVAKRRISVGRHGSPWSPEQARERAHDYAVAVKAGRDPLDERAARGAGADPARLVSTVVGEWLRRDQAGNRSCAEVERLMNRDVLPVIGDRVVETIRKRDVIELIDRIVDRGSPIMANRTLAHVKRLFRWAASRDIVESDPAAHVVKPCPVRSRDRVLSDPELVEIWHAAENAPSPFGVGVRLLMLTGARRQEVFGLQWAEVEGNGDTALIRLPPKRNKVAQERVIPLTPLAWQLLDELPRVGPCALSMTGKVPFTNFSVRLAALNAAIAHRRAQERLGRSFTDGEQPEPGDWLPSWRLHDLRRSLATGLQRLGVRLEVIEAVLGHVSGSRSGIVAVYQRHRYIDEARVALVAWSAHLTRLLASNAGAEVVPLRRLR